MVSRRVALSGYESLLPPFLALYFSPQFGGNLAVNSTPCRSLGLVDPDLASWFLVFMIEFVLFCLFGLLAHFGFNQLPIIPTHRYGTRPAAAPWSWARRFSPQNVVYSPIVKHTLHTRQE